MKAFKINQSLQYADNYNFINGNSNFCEIRKK